MFHVPVLIDAYFLKRPTNAPPCMNVILFYSNHRHVAATHMDETFINSSAFVWPFKKFRSVDYLNDKIYLQSTK